MIYCAVSTGVGAGIIIDGQLFRGSYGCAGENGHMLATPDEGFLCGCGNRGCACCFPACATVRFTCLPACCACFIFRFSVVLLACLLLCFCMLLLSFLVIHKC